MGHHEITRTEISTGSLRTVLVWKKRTSTAHRELVETRRSPSPWTNCCVERARAFWGGWGLNQRIARRAKNVG